MGRPAAITGIGVVSGCGFGVARFWRGLLSGRSAIGDFNRFDHRAHRTHLAAEVPLDLAPALPLPKHSSVCDLFALHATREAMTQAGLRPTAPDPRLGVFFGSSTGGMLEAEEWFARAVGEKRCAAIHLLAAQQTSAPGDTVARHVLAGGTVQTISTACSSATLALGAALDALRAGELDVALAGGSDALCQLTYGGFNALRSVDPTVSRPFRGDRAGLSLGEGGAVLVLETVEHAQARGAKVLGWLMGAGSACDAHHMTAPDPTGNGPARAIRRALEDAQLPAEGIDFINAHATGTTHNDAAEWEALHQLFGDRASQVPIVAVKAIVGHFLGSAGAVEAVATVLALNSGVLHPAPSGGLIDPALPVRLVLGEPQRTELRFALSTNLAFGGSNGAVVLARPDAMTP